MAAFDDDDDLPTRSRRDGGGGEGGAGSWDLEDEGPDDRDLVPDELATVRCTSCRKYIFEDSIRCPYCKHLQLESERNRKPFWFIATVIFCVAVLGGVLALILTGYWPH